MKLTLQVPVTDVVFTVKFTDEFGYAEEVDFYTYESALSHMDTCNKYNCDHTEMFVKIKMELK